MKPAGATWDRENYLKSYSSRDLQVLLLIKTASLISAIHNKDYLSERMLMS